MRNAGSLLTRSLRASARLTLRQPEIRFEGVSVASLSRDGAALGGAKSSILEGALTGAVRLRRRK